MLRPKVVAVAAPATPISGKGTKTEDEAGTKQDIDCVGEPENAHRDRGVSGAAEDRVDEKEEHDGRVAAQHDPGVPSPDRDHRRCCAHQLEQPRRKEESAQSEEQGHDQADGDALDRGRGGALGVVLADAACDCRGHSDAQSHGDRVHDRQERLGEADSRNRIGAQSRNEEHVRDGEEGLHEHLEDHRHCEQQDGTADRPLGVVLPRPAKGFLDAGPDVRLTV
jgi:hypothetical protein